MENPFDQNFEKQKSLFKQKYGKDWNSDPALYTQYLQTVYLDEILNRIVKGFTASQTGQQEITRLIQGLSQKLEKM